MLRIAVMVSGGGTNLQAIIDGIKDKTITNTEIAAVISNNADAYALTRAKDNGIEAICVSPKSYETRDEFNKALVSYDLGETHFAELVFMDFMFMRLHLQKA